MPKKLLNSKAPPPTNPSVISSDSSRSTVSFLRDILELGSREWGVGEDKGDKGDKGEGGDKGDKEKS
ncbi:hypothetical protein DSM107010_15030 [Chroococcidiopsis cubana SAG 39.79]|uniref:Uncharacterized protein n=1 Tax=Chroococcidiopsis cubana SAG 39.79 TaxID=388085 RepID=A0AB37UPK8_9CYAN|nr:hypothetical protein DSM107010_15030 [Chroococcidiopsis cubana SAG 39.79]